MAAAQAETRPDFPPAALAAMLDAGDPASEVRAVFSCSYTPLTPPAARPFRLLGLHLGRDITAAASTAGFPAARSGRRSTSRPARRRSAFRRWPELDPHPYA